MYKCVTNAFNVLTFEKMYHTRHQRPLNSVNVHQNIYVQNMYVRNKRFLAHALLRALGVHW